MVNVIIIFLVALFLCIISYLLKRDVLHPTFLFCGFWSFVLGAYIYSYYNYNLYMISSSTAVVIGLGIVSFSLVMFFQKITPNKSIPNTYNINTEISNKNNFLYPLLILGIIVGVVFTIRYFSLVRIGYGMSDIRRMYGYVSSYGPLRSALESKLYTYFTQPMLYVVIVMLPLEMYKKEKDVKLIICMIFFLIFNSSSGGRIVYYNLGIAFIFNYILRKKNGLSRKKAHSDRKKMYIIIGVMIAIMYYMSVQRGLEGNSLIKQVMIYFSGSIPYLDIRLSLLPTNMENSVFYCFFGGFFSILFWVLQQFGFAFSNGWSIANYWAGGVSLQSWYNIAMKTEFNAFVTPFYYFYIDGGYVGVVIESMLWGVMCCFSYKKMLNSYKQKDIQIYTLLLLGVFSSMVRWQFFEPKYFLAFVYIFLLNKKRKYVIK